MRGVVSDPTKEQLRREKISQARRKKMLERGFLNSIQSREKMSIAHQGKKLSNEHKDNISKSHRGITPKNFTEIQSLAWDANRGRTPSNWKGDDAGYCAIHQWVAQHRGTPNRCEECGTDEDIRYEWANISGEYKRSLDDYRRLCVSCHRKEGYARGEYVSWNKL